MVKMATALGRSGLQDWLIQRVTAVILAAYTVFIFSCIILIGSDNYERWHALFSHPLTKIATLMALISLIAHAWIGIWTITTDYLKLLAIRLFFQILVLLTLLGYFIWGIRLVWEL